jgi:hypothetical protein
MSKTLALATSIQILRNSNAVLLDETLVRQMINLGIRKIHDAATSHRGNGKYKGHRAWSQSALSLLVKNNDSVVGITNYLSHEHVVPLKVVVDKIFMTPKDTPIQKYVDIINEWGGALLLPEKKIYYLELLNFQRGCLKVGMVKMLLRAIELLDYTKS